MHRRFDEFNEFNDFEECEDFDERMEWLERHCPVPPRRGQKPQRRRKRGRDWGMVFWVILAVLLGGIFALSAAGEWISWVNSDTSAVMAQVLESESDETEPLLALETEDSDHDHMNTPNIPEIESPSRDELDAFFRQFGTDIGIYYANLSTGFVYTYNPNMVFFGASLNKANLALYVFTAAERGYIDMHATHEFTAEDWWGGTGRIRFRPAGTRFTTQQLLYYNMVHSDNVAFRMLTRYMNETNFTYRDFALEIGANPNFAIGTYSHDTSAADTAIWFYAMHRYIQSGGRYAHYFRQDILNTAEYSHPYFTRGAIFGGYDYVNVRLIPVSYPVAQKYGWSDRSFNVAGIIYAPSPFVLVIVSNQSQGAHELFEEISGLMKSFNQNYLAHVTNYIADSL
ncbi:MAG: class A beta-lactamase-related serine hydrolase [Defluviitaleaceae bacterium]|nr:class A beta-lactamase-related serine hydrolase [Defluviitaleaceae bacterium]